MQTGRRAITILLLSLIAFAAPSCGYNEIQRNDEAVKAAWAEVLNQYQRRFDLIPNLVRTVEAFARQEREVLTQVTEARSRAGSIQATPELVNDPQAFARFQQSQAELGGALSRLLVVAENYPQLRSNENFRDLQAQLEGTENRITVARNRYIQAVQAYNVTIRTFPSTLTARVFGYTEKATFQPENTEEISKPPEVRFGNPSGDGSDNSAP